MTEFISIAWIYSRLVLLLELLLFSKTKVGGVLLFVLLLVGCRLNLNCLETFAVGSCSGDFVVPQDQVLGLKRPCWVELCYWS